MTDALELDNLQRQLQKVKARRSLIDFSEYTQNDYVANWHHRVLCHYLEKWYEGEIQNLAVFMPPQHGKSELVSRKLPAWIFGRNPDAKIIACSYGADLANSMNRNVQQIIDSEAYQEVFPKTQLFGANIRTMTGHTYLRNSDEFEIVNARGYYRCAGVCGGITGRGFDFGIIDDPFKDRADANSPTIRRNVIDWFGSTFRTRRRNDSSRILLTMTRWHEGDLAGHLEELARDNPLADQWVIVKFPAICYEEGNPDDPRELGEALWPNRFSKRYLESTKVTIGPYDWAAMYDQAPSPAQGSIFQSEHFRYFDVRKVTRYDIRRRAYYHDYEITLGEKTDHGPAPRTFYGSDLRFFQCIDTAQKVTDNAAFTVVGTFAKTPDGDLLVWDIFRAKLGIPYQFPAIKLLRAGSMPSSHGLSFREWSKFTSDPWPSPLLFQAVEDKSSGEGIIQQGALAGCPFRVLEALTDKAQRASTVSTMYYNSIVWHRRNASWLPAFERELLVFPNGATLDQADVVAYAGKMCLEDAILTMPFGGNLGAVTEEAMAELRSEKAMDDVVVIEGYGDDIVIDFGDE